MTLLIPTRSKQINIFVDQEMFVTVLTLDLCPINLMTFVPENGSVEFMQTWWWANKTKEWLVEVCSLYVSTSSYSVRYSHLLSYIINEFLFSVRLQLLSWLVMLPTLFTLNFLMLLQTKICVHTDVLIKPPFRVPY